MGKSHKYLRGMHVDALVCALRRQDHGNQQMERGVVMEFGLRNLHVGGEPLGHMKESVLCVHCIRW